MASNQTKHKHTYLYAFAAVLFWATTASAFKLSLRYLSVLSLLLYASITSTSVFLLYLAAGGKLNLLKALTRHDYLRSAALGFLNPFLYYAILLKAYNLLTAQQAMTINWVWPIMLVLLSIPLLGQKIKLVSLLSIVVSFAGVCLIATGGRISELQFSNPLGVLLALISTIIWATFWICNVRDNRDEAVRLFLNFSFGTIYILLSAVLLGKIEVPPVRGLVGSIYVGLFEMGITFLAWLKALKLSHTTAHVANLVYLVPFLSLMVISLVVGEKILPSTLLGLIFIITGIAAQPVALRRKGSGKCS
jgi:drug/metabolite transporter (DMT)-like permease